jgi:alkyldihydroxyacetonephosphate synthase
VVHALRGVLDPRGVMNPGNLLPRDLPERRPLPAPPAVPVLDRESMLLHARGDAKLLELEAFLSRSGLTLGLGASAPMDATVDAWIASGAKGAPDPWLDPADHFVAGYTARLESGAELSVRPSPRRAVGPDLFALFLGMEGRVGAIRSAYLRAHGPARPRPLETGIERDPVLGETEKAWIDRIARAAASVA